jgi:hypothetical protein
MHALGSPAPLLIDKDGVPRVLRPMPLSAKGESGYNEAWLQSLLFHHPETLPIAEIDDSFSGLIPLCMEMDTPAGPIDAVFVTPTGRLALLETKLWRNPQARREVVAQILDYAKELTNWDYSRLDAQVRQAPKKATREFPGIAAWVTRSHPDLVSHRFQDAVTLSLSRGDFLLLVAGDGIRQGVGAIAQYLDRNGSLHFTFGLVECAVYEAPNGGVLVHPRVLAQSTKLIRTVLVQSDGKLAEVESEEEDDGGSKDRPDLQENREMYRMFWKEFLGMVRVEESQPIPHPAQGKLMNFFMPKGSGAMVTALLFQGGHEAFVYLRFNDSPEGARMFALLKQDEAVINVALNVKVEWRQREVRGQNNVIISKRFRGDLLKDSRVEVLSWLADHTERFVSVFRPRIERLLREENSGSEG